MYGLALLLICCRLLKNGVIYILEQSSRIKIGIEQVNQDRCLVEFADTSIWHATNSEECDVVWVIAILFSCMPRLFTL